MRMSDSVLFRSIVKQHFHSDKINAPIPRPNSLLALLCLHLQWLASWPAATGPTSRPANGHNCGATKTASVLDASVTPCRGERGRVYTTRITEGNFIEPGWGVSRVTSKLMCLATAPCASLLMPCPPEGVLRGTRPVARSNAAPHQWQTRLG